MTLADVNVLVNAFRADAGDHDRCRDWLLSTMNGNARFGVAPQVLAGFVRVVTHRRVFRHPSTISEALRFCETLLESPRAVTIVPGGGHWEIFARLCKQAKAHGNLVPDAWLAALAIESGCEWVTLDGDYARFAELRCCEPIRP